MSASSVPPRPKENSKAWYKMMYEGARDTLGAFNHLPKRGEREELPSKRRCETFREEVGGRSIFMTLSFYPDGRVGEVFLDVSREGSAIRSWMQAFAVALSVGLQHGISSQYLLKAFKADWADPWRDQVECLIDAVVKRIDELESERLKKLAEIE